MLKKIGLQQIWHHIEDKLNPSRSQMIRQVMDIYTNEEIVKIDLVDTSKAITSKQTDIFGLQIKGRNPERELAFIHEKNSIYVNIGNIKWPFEKIGIDNTNPRKHVKLEIKFFEADPDIEKHIRGYTANFGISLPIRPEFSITVPRGMKMEKSWIPSFLQCKILGEKKIRGLLKLELNIKLKCKSNENKYTFLPKIMKIKIVEPVSTRFDGKNVYTYRIEDKSYKRIYNIPETCELFETVFNGSYHVSYSMIFWGLPAFGVILIIYSIAQFILFLDGQKTPDLPFLIALFSFSFIILELNKQNYEYPLQKLIYISIGISTLVIGLVLFFFIIDSIFGFNSTLHINQTLNMTYHYLNLKNI